MGLRRRELLETVFKRVSSTSEELRLQLLREQIIVEIEIADKLDSIAVELLRSVDAMNSILERLDS